MSNEELGNIIGWIRSFFPDYKGPINFNDINWNENKVIYTTYEPILKDKDKELHINRLEKYLIKLGKYANTNGVYQNDIKELLNRLEVPLNNEYKMGEISENQVRLINEVLEPIKRECNDSKLISIIDKIFDELMYEPFTVLTLGDFDAETRKITIYNEAIRKYCMKSMDYDKYFDVYYFDYRLNPSIVEEEVLVHELFHYIHYYLNEDNGINVWKTDSERQIDEAEVVKESLADFFAFCYLKEKVQESEIDRDEYKNAMDVLIQSWRRHTFPLFPYSGAQAFIDNKTNDKDEPYGELLFREIIDQKWKDAFKCIKRGLGKGGSEAAYTLLQQMKNPEYFEVKKIFPNISKDDVRIKYYYFAINDIQKLLGIKIYGDKFPAEYHPEWLIDIYYNIDPSKKFQIPENLKDEFDELFYSTRIGETIRFIREIQTQQ